MVTEHDVVRECEGILEEGRVPTILEIVDRLGSKSQRVIGPVLKEWKRDHERKVHGSVKKALDTFEGLDAVGRELFLLLARLIAIPPSEHRRRKRTLKGRPPGKVRKALEEAMRDD